MRLILEGPDNAGKTTFARALANRVGTAVRYYHPGGKPQSIQSEVAFLEEQFKILMAGGCLLDRVTAISQRVYNPDEALNGVRAEAWGLLMELKPIVIYARPSTDRLMRTADFTWREGETEDHRQKIIKGQHKFIERYDKLFETIPCVCYNFEDDVMRDIMLSKAVKAFLGSESDEQWFRDLMYYRSV